MLMTKTFASIALALAACGGGGSSTPTPDAAPVNTMVTVSGIATEIAASGRTPQADVKIEVFKEGDTTPTATTMSGADGSYTLTFATGGTAIDGYLHATKGTTYIESFLYPPAPISADLPNITVFLLTSGTLNAATALAQAEQLSGMGFVASEVLDSANATVGGAVVTTTPAGSVRYNASNGLPSKTPTSTFTDGIGYVFNIAPGDVMIGATKAGSTFHTHKIKARPDVVTLTLIQ